MKILITTPNYKNPQLGGVANHFYGLLPYWKENVRYLIVGRRKRDTYGKYYLPWDIVKYFFVLLFWRPDAVMVNQPLPTTVRERIFLRIAKVFGVKFILHFHGFNEFTAQKMNGADFMRQHKDVDAFVVLSSQARDYLLKWGVKCPIYITTTKVADTMLEGFDIALRTGEIQNVMYLSRVEEQKGIYIALDIFAMIAERYPQMRFSVVGGGTELEKAKQYAQKAGIHNIVFTGSLTGKALIDAFKSGDVFVFTSYHEGMPTSLLEAMCFGLPIVTRPVGGVPDFFEQDKMGAMVDSFDAKDFVEPICKLIDNVNLTKEISQYNHQFGKAHFLASHVAEHMEQIFKEITKN